MDLFLTIAVVWWDYHQSVTGKETISRWVLARWYRYRNYPMIWVGVGILIGGFVMFIVGLIAGHLFWPQYAVP